VSRASDDGSSVAREVVERGRVLNELLIYRTIAMVTIAGAVEVLPAFGPERGWMALVVLLVGTGSTALARRHLVRRSRLPRWLVAVDLAMIAMLLTLAPATYPVVTTVLVVASSTWVFWFGPRFTRLALVPTGIGLLVIGFRWQPDLWEAAWAAWLLMSGFGVIVFGRLAEAMEEGRRRYDDLVNGIHAGVWEATGTDGPITFVNDHAVDMLGYTREQFFDAGFLRSQVHPDDLETLMESRRRLAEGEDVEVSFRVFDGAGQVRLIGERIKLTVDEDGRITRRRGVVVDDTDRWEAEASVRRYRDFIEGIPIALVILRLDHPEDHRSLRVVAANPAAATLVGIPVEAALGSRIVDLLASADSFLQQLADVTRLGEPMERPFVTLRGVDGVYAVRAVPLPDQCIGVSLEDVTKRARLAESFRHQALHDPLTGLPNRSMLNARLARALGTEDDDPPPHAPPRPAAPDASVALLVIDLDQFKEVNDALGHEYGDRLLVVLARRLAGRLRDCDTIARLGGDEFAVLLRSGGEAGAREVAARILEMIDQPLHVDDYRFQVAASIGIAVAPDHAQRPDELMRRADAAMYRAKASGGGVAVYAPGQEVSDVRRLELLADLRGAVQDDAFTVEYQPRLDLATMQPVGVEALVRWHHPRHGLLPPSEFIELAEVSGTIRLLTRHVTARALADVAGLDRIPPLPTSVNLSVRNLYDPQLVEWVRATLADLEVPEGTLCFELTESHLMDDPSVAMEVLQQLRDVGVRLSVDDFGTGYSSLAYLRELPIDEVKIDRSFVGDLERGDARIVRSVVDLGHNLGLHVVAEGVESATTLDRLRDIGCDSAQGFHIASPMSIEELATFLDRAHTGADAGSGAPWEPQVTGR
jgi:diguanylate cyclase (GGDEF)-like protein/PAS domain S-box-containing protein